MSSEELVAVFDLIIGWIMTFPGVLIYLAGVCALVMCMLIIVLTLALNKQKN
ncbi:MAG: hypothetical protein LBT80_04705 [Lactobacillaceae bacterium]|jgi:hypothetical protein|nr:hypothetical protein [Lactobacillaceae bacterium]